MKNYIGISRDHSASMTPIARFAAHDYNQLIGDIKNSATKNNLDTIMSVVKCGVGTSAAIIRDVTNSSINAVQPLNENQYETTGYGTPLFESVLTLIRDLKSTPDANSNDVSFLVMVITDGEENRSRPGSKQEMMNEIQRLQATDRWTFVFRVPRGGAKQTLVRYGIPEGNILEWDQTQRGVEAATVATSTAIESFYTGVKSGVLRSTSFYTNIDRGEARKVIKTQMKDITDEVIIWNITAKDAVKDIRTFASEKIGAFTKGTLFYQLTKPEREVQDYKMIIIKDKKAGKTYAGAVARDLLGLPTFGTVRVAPGDHSGYDVYIQSTSVNRKLPEGSRLAYWPNAVMVPA